MRISDWSSDVCSSDLPIQPRAQVGFHAAHQMPGVGAQVVQFGAVLGRDDEAEMVPVVGAAFLESVEVGVVGPRPVGPARLAIAAGAVALDVAQVLGERLRDRKSPRLNSSPYCASRMPS